MRFGRMLLSVFGYRFPVASVLGFGHWSFATEMVSGKGSRFVYEYDFGDGWEHEIRVEKILPLEAGVYYPLCLASKRACLPEDCGGIGGCHGLVRAIQDPEHPDHEDMLEWLGGDFDTEKFALEAINQELKLVQ